jgi:hypothetical protein
VARQATPCTADNQKGQPEKKKPRRGEVLQNWVLIIILNNHAILALLQFMIHHEAFPALSLTSSLTSGILSRPGFIH